jgi:hypothetical protein
MPVLLLNESKTASESFGIICEIRSTANPQHGELLDVAKPEQRQRAQNLLFEGGLEYSLESDFLN